MADLPRDIGFDDDPVVLLNIVPIEDMESKKHDVITSPYRKRLKSDTSVILTGNSKPQYRVGRRNSSPGSEISHDLTTGSIDSHDSKKLLLSEVGTHRKSNDHHYLQTKDSIEAETESVDGLETSCDSFGVSAVVDITQLQKQNKDLAKRNADLSKALKSLEKERSAQSVSDHTPTSSATIKHLEKELSQRSAEIASLRRELQQQRKASETTPTYSLKYQSLVDKLMSEQHFNSQLKASNGEMHLKILSLEDQLEKEHQKSQVQSQQLEQATAAVQAAVTNAANSTPKAKKKFFGLRRSGRKSSGSMKSGSERKITPLDNSLQGNNTPSILSLEDHDMLLLGQKSDDSPRHMHDSPRHLCDSPRYGCDSPRHVHGSADVLMLQTSLQLATSEKMNIERQRDDVCEELKQQQDKIDRLMEEVMEKEKVMAVLPELEATKQALQLTTREKELLESECASLKYEVESLRAERDNLLASKGKEVKAVLKEKQEMDYLRSENKALMSEVRTLIANSDGLETSLSLLKREMVTRDVKEHELKLKLRKSDNENEQLRKEIWQLKEKLTKQVSPQPSSPVVKTIATPTYEIQQHPHHNRKSASLDPPTPSIVHSRAQSEDLSSSTESSSSPLMMVRTSSGGTKALAVQVTLPKKETPLKVNDKSHSVPSLMKQEESLRRKSSDESSLGTFCSSHSPSNKSGVNTLVKMFETSRTPPKIEPYVPGNLQDKTSTATTTPTIATPTITTPTIITNTEEHSPSHKKREKTPPSNPIRRQYHRNMTSHKRSESEGQVGGVKKDKPTKKLSLQESSKITEDEDMVAKVSTNKSSSPKSKSVELHVSADSATASPSPKSPSMKNEISWQKHQASSNSIKEEASEPAKDAKYISSSLTRPDNTPDIKENTKTWPPKYTDKTSTKNTNSNSTTAKDSESTSKGSEVSVARTSPTLLTISKPKPPPIIVKQGSSGSLSEMGTSPVASLRSSWESKAAGSAPPKPLTKAESGPSSSPRGWISKPAAPPALSKTGSGPAGVVLSSPSNPTSSNLAKPNHPIARTGSSPLINNSTSNNSTFPQQNGLDKTQSHTTEVQKTVSNGEALNKPVINGNAVDDVMLRSHPSPRALGRRPASLYVSSSGMPIIAPPINGSGEKRLSSLISKLQEKKFSTNESLTVHPISTHH